MSGMIDLNAAKMQVKTNKLFEFVKENYWFIVFTILFLTGAYALIGQTHQHTVEVKEISKQNAACIYLESSKLGDGQHYMICEGQIFLKRLGDTPVKETPEQKLQEVVPTAPAPAATPPAK